MTPRRWRRYHRPVLARPTFVVPLIALAAACGADPAPAAAVADAGRGGVRWTEDETFPLQTHVFAAWTDVDGETWAAGDGPDLAHGRPGRWSRLPRPDAPKDGEEGPPPLRALHGQPGGLLVAAGDAGSVLVRADAGTDVEAVGLTAQDLQAAVALPDGRAFVAGYEGTILRRDPDGTWVEEDAHSVDNLAALAGTPDAVWALGAFGAALRLAGGSWERTDTDTGRTLAAAWSSGDEVFVVGLEGTFLRWRGDGWSPVEHPYGPYLRSVWGRGPADLYAAGWDGAVLHWDGATMCDLSPARWRFEAITGNAETVIVLGVGGRVWTAPATGPCPKEAGSPDAGGTSDAAGTADAGEPTDTGAAMDGGGA